MRAFVFASSRVSTHTAWCAWLPRFQAGLSGHLHVWGVNRAISLAPLVAWLFVAVPARAEPSSEGKVEEVTISGSRLRVTGGSVHTIQEKDMKRFRDTDANVVLSTVPGVYVLRIFSEEGVRNMPVSHTTR